MLGEIVAMLIDKQGWVKGILWGAVKYVFVRIVSLILSLVAIPIAMTIDPVAGLSIGLIATLALQLAALYVSLKIIKYNGKHATKSILIAFAVNTVFTLIAGVAVMVLLAKLAPGLEL